MAGSRARAKRQKRRHQTNMGVALVMIVVTCFAVVMFFRTNTLRAENDRYQVQEENLQAQCDKEAERSEELEESQAFVQTQQYIEQIAREKLGLVKPDETLVKPKN